MLRIIMKSKIHNATVTEANINYQGSITIDSALLKKTDILPGEKVQVINLSNASRIETYVIEGKDNSGIICMNGGAAQYAKPGDKLIIVAYALADSKEATGFKPKIVIVDANNKPVKGK
ncbi:MAG: aspartate 1-decarboxylase [Candidatus Omnitrophica bacterium]|nr:aspartate 1-decarboxylase [Candidatus Omnitrophota bacterium]